MNLLFYFIIILIYGFFIYGFAFSPKGSVRKYKRVEEEGVPADDVAAGHAGRRVGRRGHDAAVASPERRPGAFSDPTFFAEKMVKIAKPNLN
jgi:hypothetical protein